MNTSLKAATPSSRIVTTSWDDGDPNDLRVAELLASRKLVGTFYIPINPSYGPQRLKQEELRALSAEGFEIGAHSVTHKDLSKLSAKELEDEVRGSKQMLEQSLGEAVSMFCYPKGRYSSQVIREIRDSGYLGARTTRMLSMTTDFRCFEMPTTLQAFPHPSLAYIRNQGRAKSVPGLVKFMTKLNRHKGWVNLGKQLFDQVLERGGVWHLYGHSWEIEELGIWDDLQEMLDYVSNRQGVTYATNGRLLSLVQ